MSDDREELTKLRRLRELELIQNGRSFGQAAKAFGDQAVDAFGTGVIKGGAGMLGLPATLVNLVTQGGPALMNKLGINAAPAVPPMKGEMKDWLGLVESTAGPLPEQKTPLGRIAEAGVSGMTAGGFGGGSKVLGALSGLGGQTTTEMTGNADVGAAVATLPYLGQGLWRSFKPMQAEHTARNLLRNVTPEQMKEAQSKIADYGTRSGGGAAMIPAQALPPHSQAAGLAQSLATSPEGKAIVDALVKQQVPPGAGLKSPTALMQQSYQNEANSLYALGDTVRPTRAGIQDLRRELFSLPRQMGVAPGSDQQQLIIKALKETNDVLKSKPTARQLSTHADALAAKKDYIPGTGPYFPAASAKVQDLAQRTHPAIGQADALVGREKDLTRALERVPLPLQGGMADHNPGAVGLNTAIAAAGQATNHPLVTGAALVRMARSIVRGNPEKALADALADPTMKKLQDLAGAGRIKGVTGAALRAAVQAEIAAGGDKE